MPAVASFQRFRAAVRCAGGIALAAGALAALPAEAADSDGDEAPLPAAALPAGDADGLLARVAAATAPGVERPPAVQVVTLGGRLGREAPGAAADRPGSDQLVGVGYRVWMSRGRTDIGLGFGALGRMAEAPPAADASAAPRGWASAAPVVSVAMRYRVSEQAAVFADASLAHALAGTQGAGDYANAKVGVEWKGAESRLGFERGRLGLGMQLDSGYRMSLRIRKSGLGVYLRGSF